MAMAWQWSDDDIGWAYVRYSDKEDCSKVPAKFIKNYSKGVTIDSKYLYKIFWSESATDTPVGYLDSASTIPEFEEGVPDVNFGQPGLYRGLVYVVKDTEKALDEWIAASGRLKKPSKKLCYTSFDNTGAGPSGTEVKRELIKTEATQGGIKQRKKVPKAKSKIGSLSNVESLRSKLLESNGGKSPERDSLQQEERHNQSGDNCDKPKKKEVKPKRQKGEEKGKPKETENQPKKEDDDPPRKKADRLKKDDLPKKKDDPQKKKTDDAPKKKDPQKKEDDLSKKKNEPQKKKTDDAPKKRDDPQKKKTDDALKDDLPKKKDDPQKKDDEPKKYDPQKKKTDDATKKDDLPKKKDDPQKKKTDDRPKEKKDDPQNENVPANHRDHNLSQEKNDNHSDKEVIPEAVEGPGDFDIPQSWSVAHEVDAQAKFEEIRMDVETEKSVEIKPFDRAVSSKAGKNASADNLDDRDLHNESVGRDSGDELDEKHSSVESSERDLGDESSEKDSSDESSEEDSSDKPGEKDSSDNPGEKDSSDESSEKDSSDESGGKDSSHESDANASADGSVENSRGHASDSSTDQHRGPQKKKAGSIRKRKQSARKLKEFLSDDSDDPSIPSPRKVARLETTLKLQQQQLRAAAALRARLNKEIELLRKVVVDGGGACPTVLEAKDSSRRGSPELVEEDEPMTTLKQSTAKPASKRHQKMKEKVMKKAKITTLVPIPTDFAYAAEEFKICEGYVLSKEMMSALWGIGPGLSKDLMFIKTAAVNLFGSDHLVTVGRVKGIRKGGIEREGLDPTVLEGIRVLLILRVRREGEEVTWDTERTKQARVNAAIADKIKSLNASAALRLAAANKAQHASK